MPKDRTADLPRHPVLHCVSAGQGFLYSPLCSPCSFFSALASAFSSAAVSCLLLGTTPVSASICTSSLPALPFDLMSKEERSFPPSRSSSPHFTLPPGTWSSAVFFAAAC